LGTSVKEAAVLRSINCAVFVLFSLLATPLAAADWPAPAPAPAPGLEQTAERLALLYLLRARFDVMEPAAIEDQLRFDVASIRSSGFSPDAETQLEESLMAEGSYYITSLRYLIEAGGANWPLEQAASSYDSSSLQTLAKLQHAWLVGVVSEADLAPLMLAVDQINALTEGYVDVPAELDHFGSLDRLVSTALAP
jgi:hypothetical protein